MKFFIILFLISACTSSIQAVPATVKFLAEDAKIRRDGISYSTSVVHQDPNYPDQRAQSSVIVDLNTHRLKQNREVQIKPGYQSSHVQKRPKSLPSYSHRYQKQFPRPSASTQYAVEEKVPQSNQVHHSIQNPPYSPNSQSFNVGYSVSFTGNHNNQAPKSYARQRLENAEIITGSRKDVVRKPNSDFDAEDYVNSALIELKKQKISGIKPKPHKYSNKDNDGKSFINNFTPKTQEYLSLISESKPTSSSTFKQQLQSNNAQNTKPTESTWTNLSPSVEIYHSKEVPQQINFTPKQQKDQSKLFNHAAALGTSQGFDYTNALEGQLDNSQLSLVQTPSFSTNLLGQTDFKQANLDKSYSDLRNSAGNALTSFTSLSSSPTVPLNTLRLPQKTENFEAITKQLPLLQGASLPPNTPVDMSLIREPVLIPSGQKVPTDPHTITIPFDTALLQAMKQKITASSQVNEAFNNANKGQVQTLQANAGITGQQFQGQLENLQVQQPLQGFQQNVFQDQDFQQFQGQQQVQQSQQFNVYGIPQTSAFLNNGFDQYFDKYFDKLQSQETRHDAVRYPKIANNNSNTNSRIRPAKTEIYMDLRPPPPSKMTRHRRMYKGNVECYSNGNYKKCIL